MRGDVRLFFICVYVLDVWKVLCLDRLRTEVEEKGS